MIAAASARLASKSARQALRPGLKTTAAQRVVSSTSPAIASRRYASDSAKAAKEMGKSDAPWAIGSLVVFGSMFIYLTSPPKGGKKGGHGHGHDAEVGGHAKEEEEEDSDDDDSSDSDNDAKAEEQRKEMPARREIENQDDDGDYFLQQKVNSKPGPDAPAGDQHLATRSLTAEEGATKQKRTRDAGDVRRPDDITFKKGVSAAKEGHSGKENSHISDPKQVVKAAHAERDSKRANEKGQGGVEKSSEAKQANAHNDMSDEEDEDSQKVHDSPEAAQANAHNDMSEEEDEDSQKVHDSENARKANQINEEEGSHKAD